MRIAYDVDEVLLPFVRQMVSFLGTQGINVSSFDQTHSFDLHQVWGCTSEESGRRVQLFYNSSEFRALRPYPEAHYVLHVLADNEQFAITSRHPRLEALTQSQLDPFGHALTSIYHTGQYTTDGSKPSTSKALIAAELGIQVFVEDALHHAQEIALTGIPVLLLTRPWNAGKPLPDGVTRIRSLEEVAPSIERLGCVGKL